MNFISALFGRDRAAPAADARPSADALAKPDVRLRIGQRWLEACDERAAASGGTEGRRVSGVGGRGKGCPSGVE